MKKYTYLAVLIVLLGGCQSESLDIRANYRIRLNASNPGGALRARQPYPIQLELLTDSYYEKFGYQLQFYQQQGLGRLVRIDAPDGGKEAILQRVPVGLPLGRSNWQYTPEAAGPNQVVIIAQQERGYTRPDTVRFSFQVNP